MRLTCPTCRAAPHGAVNCQLPLLSALASNGTQCGRDRALHSCPRFTHGQTTLDLEKKESSALHSICGCWIRITPQQTTSNGEIEVVRFFFLVPAIPCATVLNLNLARRLGHRQSSVSNAQTFQVASEIVAKPIDNGAGGVVIAAGPNPFLANLHHSILYILNARDDLPGTLISSIAAEALCTSSPVRISTSRRRS